MVIYEYKARTITDAKLDEAPFLHTASELGAKIIRGMIQEGNISFIKIGAGYGPKLVVEENLITLLNESTYMSASFIVLYTQDEKRIMVNAAVCGQNSPNGLEARVSVVGEEEVLKRFESLATRCPRIVNDEQQQLEQSGAYSLYTTT